MKHNIYVAIVPDIQAATTVLLGRDYVLAAVFLSDPPLDQIFELRKVKLVPILIMAEDDNPEKKLEALRLGAVDYMVWPGSLERSVNYAQAIIENLTEQPPAFQRTGIYKSNGLKLDTNYHTVTVNGVEVDLTYKEYRILLLLMTHPRQFLTHQIIFSRVWGAEYEDNDKTVLANHIYKIRAKLKVSHDSPDYIKNKNGLGRWF